MSSTLPTIMPLAWATWNLKQQVDYLPEDAFRTCEFQNFNSPEQVKAGLEFLAEHGCIKKHLS